MNYFISSNLIYINRWFINFDEQFGIGVEYRAHGPSETSVRINTSQMDAESKEYYDDILQNLSSEIRHDELSFEYQYYGSWSDDEVYKKNKDFVIYNNLPDLARNAEWVERTIRLSYISEKSKTALKAEWSDEDGELLWDDKSDKPKSKQISKEYQKIADIWTDENWENDIDLEKYLKVNFNMIEEDSDITFKFAYFNKE